jgi:hypothetical protein
LFQTFRDSELPGMKMLLFDPDKFGEITNTQKNELIEQIANQIDAQQPLEIGKYTKEMEYEDWDQKRCIRAVLPNKLEFSGFEQCEYHINLKKTLLKIILFVKTTNNENRIKVSIEFGDWNGVY